jgi:hypothetical protein
MKLLASLIVIFTFAAAAAVFSKQTLASPSTVDDRVAQQFLEATLRITLYAPLTDAQGNPQYVEENERQVLQLNASEGLGTLANQAGDLLIVTHDHWQMTPDLWLVQFHSPANELLLELSGEEFQQLIRYRDGGTMLLTAPQALAAGRLPIPLGSSREVGRDDIV